MARVLITRSSHQASELAERIRALGHEPILIPTIELTEPTTFAPLDAALTALLTPTSPAPFDWLLFTSANAVEAFHRRLSTHPSSVEALHSHLPTHPSSVEALHSHLPTHHNSVEVIPSQLSTHPNSVILSGARSAQSKNPEGSHPATTSEHLSATNPTLRIAAIGSATARALESIGLPADLLPRQAIAESLAEALLPHAHQPDGTPTHFLLLRAEQARDILPDTLRAAGAEVTIAPVYRTTIPQASLSEIQILFNTPANHPDAITFTSSSTATNLIALLEATNLTLPPEILRISIGPITSQTLRSLNLPPHAESTEPTLPALVEILVKSINLKNGL
jgi:uroporphyrinogen-III synthase